MIYKTIKSWIVLNGKKNDSFILTKFLNKKISK